MTPDPPKTCFPVRMPETTPGLGAIWGLAKIGVVWRVPVRGFSHLEKKGNRILENTPKPTFL